MIVQTAVVGVRPSSDVPASAEVSRWVQWVLKQERKKWKGETHVVFVDGRGIRRLNKKFLNEPGLTDVIAFGYAEKNHSRRQEPDADIYVCVPVARQNARVYQEPVKRELCRLVVHGVLHVLGYDDHRLVDQKRMWARQEKYVGKFFPLKS